MITPARRIQALCRLCATMVPGTSSPEYAERVARLLFMTIAHESGGFRWRRQLGFRPDTTRGAFGLSQVERASLEASLEQSWADNTLGEACRAYLSCAQSPWPTEPSGAMRVLQKPEGDALSVLYCRLHYWRIPTLVPGGIVAQSEYAKRWYNTHLGKATPEQYAAAFKRHWPDKE